MQEHERQLVADHLTASRERLLDLVHGLTAEQWTFQPAEGRWSINECLEHVTRVENRVFGLIGNKIKEGPGETPPRIDDAVLASAVLDRSVGRQAPETARPVGQWPDSNELLAEFRKTRQRTAEFAATTQDDLRNHFAPHGFFGPLDCYQWLLLLGLHGLRHAQQIEEIKSAPGFPRAIASPASA
jgi:uncharacterized damage-inducible protein DinB